MLSHANINRSGNIPSLYKRAFLGSIYATSGTRYLCQVMLLDGTRIQASDIEYVNRKEAKKSE